MVENRWSLQELENVADELYPIPDRTPRSEKHPTLAIHAAMLILEERSKIPGYTRLLLALKALESAWADDAAQMANGLDESTKKIGKVLVYLREALQHEMPFDLCMVCRQADCKCSKDWQPWKNAMRTDEQNFSWKFIFSDNRVILQLERQDLPVLNLGNNGMINLTLREAEMLARLLPQDLQMEPQLSEDLEAYRYAPSGQGPMAAEWKNKPHRLIYDLAFEVERLRNEIKRLTRQK